MAKEKVRREQLAAEAKAAEEARLAEAEQRRLEAEAARAEAYANEDLTPRRNEPTQSNANVIFNAFTSTFKSEYQKNMSQVREGNARVDAAQRAMVAEQRRKDAEQARLAAERHQQQIAQQQRQAEAQRQAATQRQASSNAAASAAQQAQQARMAEMQRQAAAERVRLAAEREQQAKAESARVMASYTESSKNQRGNATGTALASGGATGTAGQGGGTGNGFTKAGTPSLMPEPKKEVAQADYGPAKAWCRANDNKAFQCMGPLQRSLSWENTLAYALEVVGCKGGFGYNPTPGTGGSGFDCGRKLSVGDYKMPLYDPWRGGGNPEKVKEGG